MTKRVHQVGLCVHKAAGIFPTAFLAYASPAGGIGQVISGAFGVSIA